MGREVEETTKKKKKKKKKKPGDTQRNPTRISRSVEAKESVKMCEKIILYVFFV